MPAALRAEPSSGVRVSLHFVSGTARETGNRRDTAGQHAPWRTVTRPARGRTGLGFPPRRHTRICPISHNHGEH
ncbi:hypothetical protein FMEAI12_3650037 [Parafrankia sp. Ea1.12]|nr:hypothetical protein FMEAI12_3650037 [Parafrankia sp. Ea1.12]